MRIVARDWLRKARELERSGAAREALAYRLAALDKLSEWDYIEFRRHQNATAAAFDRYDRFIRAGE